MWKFLYFKSISTSKKKYMERKLKTSVDNIYLFINLFNNLSQKIELISQNSNFFHMYLTIYPKILTFHLRILT